MTFKQFMELHNDPDATVTIRADKTIGDKQQPDATVDLYGRQNRTDDSTVARELSGPLVAVFQAMKGLDPFLAGRGHGYRLGSPEYISPEMASRDREQDDDNLTDLYNTLARSSPEVAARLKNVVAAFRPFHQAVVRAMQSSGFRPEAGMHENRELASRLDLKMCRNIAQAVEAVNQAMSDLSRTAHAAKHPDIAALAKTFQQFVSVYKQNWREVERHLQTAHSSAGRNPWR